VNPELEALVSAEEQARARVRVAREAARARLDSIVQALSEGRDRRARELEAALQAEIEAIRAETSRRVEERRRRRAERREQHRRSAGSLLPAAEDAFVRVLTEDGVKR
jgi:hypothetical protein